MSHRSAYFYLPVMLSVYAAIGPAKAGAPPETPAAQTTAPQVAPPANGAPAPPAVETPDYPEAVWAPAAPTNFKPSDRPSAAQAIDRIVIHDIEGPAMSAVRWFQNPKAQTSSHYVIDAKTGAIYQQVKERDVAWHAGDRITNARSVGIEHGGYAYRPGFFTVKEYEASAALVRDISARYNIPRDREHIIGHFEVPDSANPGKFGGRSGHTDPGPYWDWDYFMTLVRNDARPPLETLIYPSGIKPLPAPPFVIHPGETKALTFPKPSAAPQKPEDAPATFSLENTGDDPWLADQKDKPVADRRKAGTVFLGTASGRDSVLAAADWISPRYVGSSADGDIAPGGTGKFAVSLRAPADFLGTVTESFRLVSVPTAPRQPVPFGETITITARVEPWDIVVSLPDAAPTGWNTKTMPGGSRVYWRKSAKSPAATPAPQSVIWQASLPVPGEWDVYVRYPAGSGRTAGANYAIGTQTKKLSQQAGGGQWQKLGRYLIDQGSLTTASAGTTFASTFPGKPLAYATVVLDAEAAAPGILVAGDVRFVGPFPAKQKR